MARRDDAQKAAETLQEIDSAFDRLANWVQENPIPVLATLGGILAVAAIIGAHDVYTRHTEDRAAAAVASIHEEYLRKMGASPGSLDFEEPANPEIGRQVRSEFVVRFDEAAEAHPGTAAAVNARMEAGTLHEEAGDLAAAIASWEAARDEADSGTALRGLVLMRLGSAYESEERFEDAAEAYAEAGSIEQLPVRKLALADAARCFAEVGDVERAIAVYDQAVALSPATPIPPYVKARLEELKAQR